MKYKKKLNKKTYEKTKYETFIIHYKENAYNEAAQYI